MLLGGNMTVSAARSDLRVLVVDDDIDTVESTALLFRMQGHETTTACNGTDAIEQVKVLCPQLILLDIAMPIMDGYQVARELRNISCANDSTIVALTGYARPADRRRCAEAGFDLHLPKPLDFEVLEQLTHLLKQSRRLREESAQLTLKQADSLVTLIKSSIQMAETFLDVSTNTSKLEVRQRCLAKAEKTYQKMSELVQSKAAGRTDLRLHLTN